MKKSMFLFATLVLCLNATAQIKFFMEVSGNHSLLSKSDRVYTTEVPSDVPQYKMMRIDEYKSSYTNKPGGNVMAGAQYSFSPQISLEPGIDFCMINFKQDLMSQTVNFYYDKEMSPSISQSPISPKVSSSYTQSDFNLFYLNIPISVFYHFLDDKLAAGVGIVPGFLITSKGGSAESSNFNKGSVGMQVQLRYRFMDTWWITGAFQEYNSYLYPESAKQSFSRNRLIKLGLRYDF